MKLIEAIKGLVQGFWNENTRPYSNQKYVLKSRNKYRDHEPHIKHFHDITRDNCMRYLGQYIVHLTWAKDISINPRLGMFE
jgi:hypothetical protein